MDLRYRQKYHELAPRSLAILVVPLILTVCSVRYLHPDKHDICSGEIMIVVFILILPLDRRCVSPLTIKPLAVDRALYGGELSRDDGWQVSLLWPVCPVDTSSSDPRPYQIYIFMDRGSGDPRTGHSGWICETSHDLGLSAFEWSFNLSGWCFDYWTSFPS